jgi:hypothetical protein
MSSLILKRASASRQSGEWNDDDFDVLADGVVVGRIFKANGAPVRLHRLIGVALQRSRAGQRACRSDKATFRSRSGVVGSLPVKRRKTRYPSTEVGRLNDA